MPKGSANHVMSEYFNCLPLFVQPRVLDAPVPPRGSCQTLSAANILAHLSQRCPEKTTSALGMVYRSFSFYQDKAYEAGSTTPSKGCYGPTADGQAALLLGRLAHLNMTSAAVSFPASILPLHSLQLGWPRGTKLILQLHSERK